SLLVRDSPQVLVRGGSNRAFALVRATVVLTGCSVTGIDRDTALTVARPAIDSSDSTVQVVDGTLHGGNGRVDFGPAPQPNQPAIAMPGGSLRLLAPTTVSSGSSTLVAQAAALTGTGSVRIDPQVVLVTSVAPPIAATLAVQSQSMPSVRST